MVACALSLAACGPPKTYTGPIRDQPAKKVVVKAVDLSERGIPVKLDQPIEMIGYMTVWVQGTRLLVTLETTAWNEVDGEREGRARLGLELGGEKQSVTIEEEEVRSWNGFKIRVDHADEKYRDGRGTWDPHVKLTITR